MAQNTDNINTQFELTNELLRTEAEAKGLTKIDKSILVHLSFHMTRNKYQVFTAEVSYKMLEKMSGISPNTIGRSLKKMEDLGYLSSEMRFDKSKVYTWLGFESNKTIEVINFKVSCQDKQDKIKEFNRVRGEILGRNTSEFKKLLRYAETLKQTGYSEDSLSVIEKANKVKEATRHNIYFKEYEPYKELTRSQYKVCEEVPSIEDTICESCGYTLDESFCVNPECDSLPF